MSPLEKALTDIDMASRTSETSSSINYGRWVGYGACVDIINELYKEIHSPEYEYLFVYFDSILNRWVLSDIYYTEASRRGIPKWHKVEQTKREIR